MRVLILGGEGMLGKKLFQMFNLRFWVFATFEALYSLAMHETFTGCPVVYHGATCKSFVYIIRYADDLVLAAEHEGDVGELLEELEDRLEEYGLSLNKEKTRVIRFGRKPGSGTFDFLRFTHTAGKDRQGRYLVIRKTARKRLNRSLKAIGVWCKKYRHRPLEWQCRELGRKQVGHYNYFGIRGNFKSLGRFNNRAWMVWWRSLRRRSQKTCVPRLKRLLRGVFVLPKPRITHLEGWLSVNPGGLLGRAGCGNAVCPDM